MCLIEKLSLLRYIALLLGGYLDKDSESVAVGPKGGINTAKDELR